MYYVIQCGFSEFLIQLCIKNAFSLGPCRNITTMCRKIAFFWVRAEILLSRDKVSLESHAGPFLGFVKKYWFLEKYTPLNETPQLKFQQSKKVINIFSLVMWEYCQSQFEGEPCAVPAVRNISYWDAPTDEHSGGDISSIMLQCKNILGSTKCAPDPRGKRSIKWL